MYVTIVSVGPCRVIDLHRVREEANGVEFIMLVDNGREYVVWRVHEMYDDSYPAGHSAAVDKFHAFNGQYYGYDDRAAATVQFLSRSGLDRATLASQYANERAEGRIRTLTEPR